MTTIIKQYQLNLFDPAVNSNKVWIGAAYSDGSFETRFGRVRDAANLASRRKNLGSSFAAENELEKLRGEKLRKGYRDTNVLTDGEQIIASGSTKQNLAVVAAKQIGGSDDADTAALIKYLADVNIHHITQSTSIRYNSANATFSTPLGILTTDAITEARTVLARIETLNGAANFSRPSYIRDYFQIVPHDFGVKIPRSEDLLDTSAKIQTELQILDALDAALLAAAPVTDDAQIFACRLTKLPHWTEAGKQKFREIKSLFEKTRNSGHGTSSLKLTRVYEVEIDAMKKDFDAAAARLSNVRQDLWHGTKASNLLSILKNGLIIPPRSSAHCTGRMFGNGIYSSLQSTKALNYATDMWNSSGAGNQRTFMFLCEAALGVTHQPRTSGGSLPVRATDSTWVEPNTAGVINQECIVYETAQMNLRYLCEFGNP